MTAFLQAGEPFWDALSARTKFERGNPDDEQPKPYMHTSSEVRDGDTTPAHMHARDGGHLGDHAMWVGNRTETV
jgi:hypothetical protein